MAVMYCLSSQYIDGVDFEFSLLVLFPWALIILTQIKASYGNIQSF